MLQYARTGWSRGKGISLGREDVTGAADPVVGLLRAHCWRLSLEQPVVRQQPDSVKTIVTLQPPDSISKPRQQGGAIGLGQCDGNHPRMAVV